MEATAEAPQCGGDFGHFCDRKGLNLGIYLDQAAFYYLSPIDRRCIDPPCGGVSG
jgi:hypothetical protein